MNSLVLAISQSGYFPPMFSAALPVSTGSMIIDLPCNPKESGVLIQATMLNIFGSKKASVSNIFGCVVEPQVFDLLLSEWKEKVAKASAGRVILSNEIIQEFQKRLHQTTEKDSSGMVRSGVKAKLSLNNKNLTDDIVILLLEIFLKHPVISKLELHKNRLLTNNCGTKIVEFLKAQIKYCSTVNIDERLATPMLCEITIDGCNITDSVESEIIQLSNILKYCNAKLYIRKKFVSYGSPGSLSEEFYEQIWIDMFGKSEKKEVHELFMMREKNDANTAIYNDLENAFIHILTVKAVLPVLTTAQLVQLEPVNVSSSKSKTSAVSVAATSNSSGSPHSNTKGNSSRSDHSGVGGGHVNTHSHNSVPSALTESHLNLHSMSQTRLATIKEDKIDDKDESVPSMSNVSRSITNKRHASPPLSHHRMSSAAIVIDPNMAVPLPLQVLTNQPVPKSPPLSPARLNGIFKEDRNNPDQSKIGSIVDNSLIHGHENGNFSLSAVQENQKLSENRKPKPNLTIVPSKPFIAGSTSVASSPVRHAKSVISPSRGRQASPNHNKVSRSPSPEKKDKNVAKVVVDFSSNQYMPYAALLKPISSIIGQLGHSVSNIKVLILKDNSLTDSFVSKMNLFELKHLTDLDLGKNNLSLIFDIENINNVTASNILPTSLLRLDISHNKIRSISALVSCLNLQVLNASNNKLATVDVLPLKLERLDVSDNELKHLRSLRVVSMCHRIQALGVAGNPFLQSTNVNINVRVFDMFPNLVELDGIIRPGGKINKGNLSARKANVETKSRVTNSISRKEQLELDRERSIRRKELRDSEMKKIIEVKKEEEIQEHYKTIKKLDITEINYNCRRLSTSKIDLTYPQQQAVSISSIISRRSTTTATSNITPFDQNASNIMSINEAIELVDDWILHCTHEVGRAVEVARLAFELCLSTPVLAPAQNVTTKEDNIFIIDPQLVENFSNGLDRISLLNPSSEVDRAISSLNYHGESETEAKLSTTIENMTHLVTVLKKIQKKTKVNYLTREELALDIDRIMNTDVGKYVNLNVLSLFGCSYDPFLFASILKMDKQQNTQVNSIPIITNITTSTQNMHTTNGIIESEISITSNIKTDECNEISHDIERFVYADTLNDDTESYNSHNLASTATLTTVEYKNDDKVSEIMNPQSKTVLSADDDPGVLISDVSYRNIDALSQMGDSDFSHTISVAESSVADNLANKVGITSTLVTSSLSSTIDNKSDTHDGAIEVIEDSDATSKRPSTVIRYCDSCSAIANFNCGKCHDTYYCSKSCQTKSWKSHKKVCAGVIDSNRSNVDIGDINSSIVDAEESNLIPNINTIEVPISGVTKPPATVPSGLSLKERLAARVASIKDVK